MRRSGTSTLDDATLREIIGRIVEVADPERIILFGSAARGEMGRHSDVDLIVVKGGEFDHGRLLGDIYAKLQGVGRAVDVVLVTTEQFLRYRDTHCLVIAPAVREGREVYRSPDSTSEESMHRSLLPVGVLILAVWLGACAGEGDWSRFRGPNGTGLSDATTVPVKWTEQDYNWKIKLPGIGHSSPVLWSERIYLTCGDPATATRMILCLDTATGHTLWQRDYPSKTFRQSQDNSYATATPAADADGVVVTWSTPEEVVLLALDADGRDAWRRNLGPFVAVHGSGTSPIIVDDLVVLGNDQEDPKALPGVYGKDASTTPLGKSFLIAVDRRTGQTRWQAERRTRLAAYSTPCVRRPEGGRPELIFTSTAHGITGIDLATGKVNWEIDNVFRDRCVGSPVLGAGLVIAGFGYGAEGTRYVAVHPGSREKGIEPTLAYDLKKPVPLVPTPLVKDGRLFLWGDDGTVACLDVSTGTVIWREHLDGAFYGSPVCAGNRLYCIAKNGDVFVIAASDKFELLARVPLGEASHATPAVAGGVMYLRTRSLLFSLGGKRP